MNPFYSYFDKNKTVFLFRLGLDLVKTVYFLINRAFGRIMSLSFEY